MKEFKVLGYTFGKAEQKTWEQQAIDAINEHRSVPKASALNDHEYQIIETVWDGEKSFGELGAPLDYLPDYTALSYRSWQAFTESDLAQIIIKGLLNWVIGTGLKLQAEPIKGVIEREGFEFNSKEFKRVVEERFRLYAKTNDSTYSRMMNYNKGQRSAYLNAIVSGDILCIEMMEKGLPVKRLIDGSWVQTPGMDEMEKAEKRGNKIVHGVEINKRNEHVAFYVYNQTTTDITEQYTRIVARGEKTGRLQAYLLYGSEHRIDSVRGMPLLSAVLEKMKKLDRYNEAIVASAEEAAKIPWSFEHDQNSDGTNPDIAKAIEHMNGSEPSTDDKVVDMSAQSRLVKKTYQKEPLNMPIGAKLKKHDSGMEKDQEAFTTGNFIYICAALEIPYEVALMKYVNSFSSSRMASQSFLTILQIKRTLFNDAYNKPFYKLFLDSQILTGKVVADGYFTAQNSNDVILLEAYQNCRFTGPGVPQANPLQEVKSEVEKIGAKLTTREESMERLGGGDDFETTIDKLEEENKIIQEKIPDPEPTENNTNNGLDKGGN